MTTYNKLVRDHIPAIIEASGRTYTVEVFGGEEFDHALRDKLIEEGMEVRDAESQEELVTELADVLEIVETLARWHGVDIDIIRDVQAKRRSERGGFEQRLRLIATE